MTTNAQAALIAASNIGNPSPAFTTALAERYLAWLKKQDALTDLESNRSLAEPHLFGN